MCVAILDHYLTKLPSRIDERHEGPTRTSKRLNSHPNTPGCLKLSTARDAADREVAGLHEVGVPHVLRLRRPPHERDVGRASRELVRVGHAPSWG